MTRTRPAERRLGHQRSAPPSAELDHRVDTPSDRGDARRLVALAIAVTYAVVAVGFGRLYEDGGYLWPLLAAVAGAAATAEATRTLGAPRGVRALAGVLGLAAVVSWCLFPATLWLALPTGATFTAARESLATGTDAFRVAVPPTPVLPGFQLATMVALWGSVWFADWTAFRLRVVIEPLLPAGVLFVVGAALADDRNPVAPALAFVCACGCYALAQAAWRHARSPMWPNDAAIRRSILGTGAALLGLALAVTAIVVPVVPGRGADPWIDLEHTGDGGRSRTTISPIVDLRKRLVSQADTELFTVTSNRPAYWRLTSLERFDGTVWSSDGSFRAADGELPDEDPEVPRRREVRQEYRIRALQAIWAPAALRARAVPSSSEPLRFDPTSATLIVDADHPTSDGLAYRVTSEVPVLSTKRLQAATGRDPAPIRARYLGLPSDLPPMVSDMARDATRSTTNRFDAARALQDWFRSRFGYSLDVPPGNGSDALAAFLGSRSGYCEQFAGAFAAMARSLGIPARVAVGFTPGEADPDRPGTYIVRGRHAHAWPEVYLPAVGWVAFEPTPGRGIPDAEGYTGVAQEQDPRTAPAVPPVSVVPSTSPDDQPSASAPRPSAPPSDEPRSTGLAARPGTGGDGGGVPVLVASAAVALLGLAGAFALRHRRLHGQRRVHENAVEQAWAEARRPVRRLTGAVARPSETPTEFAGRVAPSLDDDGAFDALAALVTRATWDPNGPSEQDASAAKAALATLQDLTVRGARGQVDQAGSLPSSEP